MVEIAFFTSVGAKKKEKTHQSSFDQGLFTTKQKTAAMCHHLEGGTYPPPPISPFVLIQSGL